MDSDSSPGPLKELTTSRARFIAELGERVATLRQGLGRAASTAEPTAELNAVRRRLHALAAAAEVLRFTPAAEALAGAEAALTTSGSSAPGAPARERVARVLDLLPSLVLGVSVDLRAELEAGPHRTLRDPLLVVVFGDATLEALLHKPGPLHGAETHATRDPERVLSLILSLSPDILLLDGDDPHTAELLPRIRQAAGPRELPVVAVGNFAHHEPLLRLVRRGVLRIQPQPVDPGTLQRTLRQVSPSEPAPPMDPAHFRRLTPEQLVYAIAAEARRAFTVSESSARQDAPIDFGSGAEVLASLWAAFARIRGLAGASEGRVSFSLPGPHGAVPIAPAALSAEVGAASSDKPSSAVALAGRRFVVVDDDVALLSLLSRTLQQLGAVVLPARDALHALELAEQHWPDAVISDTLMPGIDGFELCRRIRQDIALADLPVALVTWKEHLLERARFANEGRASGHGALDPRSIAPALEACLLPRATLEQRLAHHDEVHGRLDGLTPRLLLQLVCSRRPNALLSLQSGRLKFELSVSDGRLVHARLHDDGRPVAQGLAVLGPFLGVRVGRFSARPLFSPPDPHFTGDLMTVLDPVIARARHARDRLQADLAEIERVSLDPHVVAHFLEDSGASHQLLVTQLGAGTPPRKLVPPRSETTNVEAPRVVATLLDLARRGAIVALLDGSGHDLLSPALGADMPRERLPTPSPVPVSTTPGAERTSGAVLALSEAVFQAVSAPMASSAARTHPGLAPPANAESMDASGPPRSLTSSRPAAVAPEPREVPEAWSSEPEDDNAEDFDDKSSELRDPDDATESPRAATRSARLLSLGSPLLVTLGAAAFAFVGIRALTNGGWGGLRAALHGAFPVADAGVSRRAALPRASTDLSDTEPAPPETNALTNAELTTGEPTAAERTTEEDGLLAEQRKVPINVTFSSELLDLPPQAKLRPGHGLLEVRTWQPQQIYVDGVFMGNYENRLIPLSPGTYQLRLRDGARDMERSVQVEAGRRTRLLARPKSQE